MSNYGELSCSVKAAAIACEWIDSPVRIAGVIAVARQPSSALTEAGVEVRLSHCLHRGLR